MCFFACPAGRTSPVLPSIFIKLQICNKNCNFHALISSIYFHTIYFESFLFCIFLLFPCFFRFSLCILSCPTPIKIHQNLSIMNESSRPLSPSFLPRRGTAGQDPGRDRAAPAVRTLICTLFSTISVPLFFSKNFCEKVLTIRKGHDIIIHVAERHTKIRWYSSVGRAADL